jgi:hypothetical protein
MIPSARDMIDKLESYFYAAIEKPVYLCLMILDPRVKATLLTPKVLQLLRLSKESIIQTFKNEAKQFTDKQGENNPEKNRETKPITQDTMRSSIYKTKKRKITSLDEEVEVYLSSDCEDEAYNPLSYWNANNKQFPTLSNMARTFLAVPASSAPTKQAFSSSQYIQDYTQNRLNPNTLQSFICLKNWLSEKLIDVDDVPINT